MKKREVIIILIIMGCAFIVFMINNYNASNKRIVTITIENKLIKQEEINDKTSEIIKVPLHGETIKIDISKGRVRIPRLPDHICPNGICTATGWIKNPGETIVCLPNKMIVEIKK